MKPILKQLLVLFVINIVFSFAILGITNSFKLQNNKMAVDHAIWIFTREIGDDSWRPMKLAYDHWKESQGQSLIYSELLLTSKVKFQYPPTALLLTRFMENNQVNLLAFSTGTTFLFLLIMLASVIATTLYSYGKTEADQLSIGEKVGLGVLITLLFFTFYPTVKAGTLGQIQVWLNGLFALAILCYFTGYETISGILLGLMASIKPQYALFILWGLFRGNKRLVIAMVVTGATGLILGMRVFGLGMYVDYLRGLSFLAQHGESYYSNQSFNGLAGRIFSVKYPEIFNNTKWRGYYFPPYNTWIFAFTQITSIAILLIGLIKTKSSLPEARSADFLLMGLAATLASPIAWEHHYGILFPIFVCLGLSLWYGEAVSKNLWTKIAFVVCYLLAANVIPFTKFVADSYLNVLQSYLFFAASGVFILLIMVKHGIFSGSK